MNTINITKDLFKYTCLGAGAFGAPGGALGGALGAAFGDGGALGAAAITGPTSAAAGAAAGIGYFSKKVAPDASIRSIFAVAAAGAAFGAVGCVAAGAVGGVAANDAYIAVNVISGAFVGVIGYFATELPTPEESKRYHMSAVISPTMELPQV